MTTLPQPAAPSQAYTASYDAWNRLIQLTANGSTVAVYQYDGLKRRTIKSTYANGVLSVERHYYHSANWRVLEERLSTSPNPERQFVWGIRYIDNLVLRDRDTTGNGVLNERMYSLQDANWNVTAIVAPSGAVQERYAYDGYGVLMVLTPMFGPQSSSNYQWEVLYAGYRLDNESSLYHVRHRYQHPLLGVWLQRDTVLSANLDVFSLYAYVGNNPIGRLDPTGEIAVVDDLFEIIVVIIFVILLIWAYGVAYLIREPRTITYRIPCRLPRLDLPPFPKPEPELEPKPWPGPIDINPPPPLVRKHPCDFPLQVLNYGVFKLERCEFFEDWEFEHEGWDRACSACNADPSVQGGEITLMGNDCSTGGPEIHVNCYEYHKGRRGRNRKSVFCCPCCESHGEVATVAWYCRCGR